MDQYLVDRCKEIEVRLADAVRWATNNDKLGAHLAAYISVLVIGVLEDCIEHLVAQRATRAGDAEVAKYVQTVLGNHFRNPDYSAISGLLKQFSEDYQRRFADRIDPNGNEASALRSVLENKNNLAHIGTEKLILSLRDVDDYFRRIMPILRAVEDILAQPP